MFLLGCFGCFPRSSPVRNADTTDCAAAKRGRANCCCGFLVPAGLSTAKSPHCGLRRPRRCRVESALRAPARQSLEEPGLAPPRTPELSPIPSPVRNTDSANSMGRCRIGRREAEAMVRILESQYLRNNRCGSLRHQPGIANAANRFGAARSGALGSTTYNGRDA